MRLHFEAFSLSLLNIWVSKVVIRCKDLRCECSFIVFERVYTLLRMTESDVMLRADRPWFTFVVNMSNPTGDCTSLYRRAAQCPHTHTAYLRALLLPKLFPIQRLSHGLQEVSLLDGSSPLIPHRLCQLLSRILRLDRPLQTTVSSR